VTLNKGKKGKHQVATGKKQKSSSPEENTKKVVECAKYIGWSTMVRKLRQ
jgi:hypothetical protein